MSHCNRAIVAALGAFALQMTTPAAIAASAEGSKAAAPAKIEAIAGTKLSRVTLTQKAAQRLDIRTGAIGVDESGRKIAPYTSLFYDLAGEAWVYTNPEPLSFVRQKVTVELIKGPNVYLKDGPAAGTHVVTVGVPELYGTEKGVGH
jgi:hypothetical protein